MDLQKDLYKPFMNSAFQVYNNKFTLDITEKEKRDIAQFMGNLVSVPTDLSEDFCIFIFNRTELPAVVASVLFASMNKMKGFDIDKKYFILKNEVKYSPKSLNMLKTICDIYEIKLEEKRSIFGKTKIKLEFPLGFKEKVLQEKKNLVKKTEDADQAFANEYVDFVNWWVSCKESEISSNEILFGAYQVMHFYNEVCNGGFDQFWDFVEDSNWDIEQIKKSFKELLPFDFYTLFENALKAHSDGEDCEKYNSEFDYDKMQDEVLPQLAGKVIKIIKKK